MDKTTKVTPHLMSCDFLFKKTIFFCIEFELQKMLKINEILKMDMLFSRN
jgi:hypothetical protein